MVCTFKRAHPFHLWNRTLQSSYRVQTYSSKLWGSGVYSGMRTLKSSKCFFISKSVSPHTHELLSTNRTVPELRSPFQIYHNKNIAEHTKVSVTFSVLCCLLQLWGACALHKHRLLIKNFGEALKVNRMALCLHTVDVAAVLRIKSKTNSFCY